MLADTRGRVLLDLNGLSFVDSTGVSVLIRARQEAEANGRQLVLRRPTAQLREVFAVIGLTNWLDFEDP